MVERKKANDHVDYSLDFLDKFQGLIQMKDAATAQSAKLVPIEFLSI